MEGGGVANDEVLKAFFSAIVDHIIGAAAVLHAVMLFFSLWILLSSGASGEWLRLWVGFTTLWFLWPIVLAVRAVKFVRVALVPLALAGPFVFLCWHLYAREFGPDVFGLRPVVYLTPISMFEYVTSYISGRLQAKDALRKGGFVLEGYGLGFFAPKAPNFSREALKQSGIEQRHVAGCGINTLISGHADGWNDATMAALRVRCPDIVKVAEDEDARWQQSYNDGEKAGRQDALNDLQAGRLAIEVPDPPKQDADFERMLHDSYHIGLRRVYPHADPKMMNNVFGHQAGYNQIADREIRRRFGKAADESIWSEWAKLSVSSQFNNYPPTA